MRIWIQGSNFLWTGPFPPPTSIAILSSFLMDRTLHSTDWIRFRIILSNLHQQKLIFKFVMLDSISYSQITLILLTNQKVFW
jgi:hypothetical protein